MKAADPVDGRPAARRHRRRAYALIAGGGTGGHVVPALAIGRALVERGHPASSIHFVGSRRGLECRLVPAAGFALTALGGRGIVRRLAWANVGAAAGLAGAVVRALVLVGRTRPAVVVSVGGYASVAATLAAFAWRVPIVVAEQNAVPGAANRLAGRVARASAVSFAGTALPRAVLTGNPVSAEILAVDRGPAGRAAARAALDLPPDRAVVAVVNGSLGARRVNEAVVALAALWGSRRDVAVRHVVGARDWDSLAAGPEGSGLVYQQVRFESRMDLLYAAADVVVSRPGGATLAELAVVGLPSVLVPRPGSPGDHQTGNARHLEGAGAAVVVPDEECDANRLARELDALIGSPARLAEMAVAARRLGRPGAAAAVAALVEGHARA
ncbi:MAG: UDP-N-acetylglucosamine--N-acetylmuramyl-(pentapeptide) pyrophosphoryl-undecaprenol N-acetylglucosamine transferase [Acidimicrobiales bacterium]